MKEFPYEDIVHLPHHVSKTHPQMPRTDRAAQFAPFAALTGHAAAIEETARLTDYEREPGEEEAERLNRQYTVLQEHIAEQPGVTFTYFVPDGKKAGGAYAAKTGNVRRIDGHDRAIILTDGSRIPMERLLSMEGALFAAEQGE